MKKIIVFTIYQFFTVALFSQTNSCLKIYEDGDKLRREGKYDKALEKLKQLEICDHKNALISQRSALQDDIFAAIINQKKQAIDDKNKAIEAKDKANIAETAARQSSEKATRATKEAKQAKSKSDSLNIYQYNKSIAYNTIQNDPTLAWNIIRTLDSSLTNMKDITYTLTVDDKNEFYKKTFTSAGIIRAIGWQLGDNNTSTLLIATNEGMLRYWNTEGSIQDSFAYQKDNILCVISKDGRYMMSANADSTFAIWDLRTHKSISQKHVGSMITAIAVSNANTYWAVAFNNFFEVYDRKGTLLDRVALNIEPHTIAISENGTIIVGLGDKQTQFFELKKGVKIYPEKPYLNNFGFHTACFVENTNQVLMGLQKNFTAQLSDLDDNKPETPSSNHQIIGHSNGVMSVAVSKNPDYLATGSQDKTVILWQNFAGYYRELAVLKGHENVVAQLAFSQNGQYIASTTVNEVKIWLINCREIAKSPVGSSTYFSLTYLPNSKDSILAGDGLGNIHLINTHGDILKRWKNSSTKINTLAAFHQYDAATKTRAIKFISGSEDGKVSIWHIKNTQPDTVLLYPYDDNKAVSVRSIALHDREKSFFIAYADGKIVNRKINGDSISVYDSYSPITKIKVVQKSLIIAYENGTIKLVSTQDYARLSDNLVFDDTPRPIDALAVSNSGRYVVASSEHDIKIWDLMNPNLVTKPIREAHNNHISDLQLSSDDKYLFSVGWDRLAYMWVRDGYKLSKFYKVSDADNGSMASIAVALNDSAFATGSGSVNFWRTPQLLATQTIEKRTDIHKFVLMPITFYKANKNLDILQDAAKKFAEIESYEKADTLFKMVSKVISDSLKKEKDQGIVNELNTLRRNINTERALLLNEDYDNKNAFDKLVGISQDTLDLAHYSHYFFERKMWRHLESACLKHQKMAKWSDVSISGYLYIANIELNEAKKEAFLPPFNASTSKENLIYLRSFFKDLAAKAGHEQIRQKVEYAKIAYILCQKAFDEKNNASQQGTEIYRSPTANLENVASDNINYHWYLIQKGDIKKAKEVIEEGFELLKGQETAEQLASSYALMRMNYAHTLLFTGHIAEARDIINAVVDAPFVDNRYPTFRQAYLDDFNEIEKYDSVPTRGQVIPTQYRSDYLTIKAELMRESIEIVQAKTVFTPDWDKNTEGSSESVKSTNKKYFIIVGSFKSQKDAQIEVDRLKKWKILHLKIEKQEERYRIVALNTSEEKEAEAYKKMLYDTFKITAWVYEKK